MNELGKLRYISSLTSYLILEMSEDREFGSKEFSIGLNCKERVKEFYQGKRKDDDGGSILPIKQVRLIRMSENHKDERRGLGSVG